jgi:hypothetical protein
MDSALTWQARQGRARLGLARSGAAWKGRAGWVRQGSARQGRAGLGRAGWVRQGSAGHGRAGLGRAGSAWHGMARLGSARSGEAWQAGMNRVDTNERISTYGQDGYVGFGFECFDDCACIGGRRPFGPSKRQCVCVNRTYGSSRRIVQIRRCGFQHP